MASNKWRGIRSELGRSEPGPSGPGRSEPGRSEPGRSEPVFFLSPLRWIVSNK